jgi:hypothetical protein
MDVIPNMTVNVMINKTEAIDIEYLASRGISMKLKKAENIRTAENENNAIEKRVSFFLNSRRKSFLASNAISFII